MQALGQCQDGIGTLHAILHTLCQLFDARAVPTPLRLQGLCQVTPGFPLCWHGNCPKADTHIFLHFRRDPSPPKGLNSYQNRTL